MKSLLRGVCLVCCFMGLMVGVSFAEPPAPMTTEKAPATRPALATKEKAPTTRPTSKVRPAPKVRPTPKAPKVLQVPINARVGSLDPIYYNSIYDAQLGSLVVEPLLEYDYVKRPLTLKPLLLKGMPVASADKKTYTFTLRKGIRFHPSPCFPKGKGRELIAKDVFFSIKRMANRALFARGWWIFSKKIVGLDKFRLDQYYLVKRGKPFNYNAAVPGLVQLGRYKFQIKLNKPDAQFLHRLTMSSTGIVARETVKCNVGGKLRRLGSHPVGTGPFVFQSKSPGTYVYVKNKGYRHSRYPTSFSAKDKQNKLHLDAGKRLPRVDKLIARVNYLSKQWMQFLLGRLDYIVVPNERMSSVMDKKRYLKSTWKRLGYTLHRDSLLDFIYTGFNFKDPIVGGYSKRARYLRKALSYAIDYEAINRVFYSGLNTIYQGAVPPGLAGFAGPRPKRDLKKALRYLELAGYPGGRGLPVLHIATSMSSGARERERMLQRQFAEIGVKVRYELSTFPQLSNKLRRGTAQMFSLAWASDYPDAENNLMLFYGPNASPGPNNWNYNNPKYNELFQRARLLSASPQQTMLYLQLNQILIDDVVFLGSSARTRFYLGHPRLRNFKPSDVLASYFKYVTIVPPAIKKSK